MIKSSNRLEELDDFLYYYEEQFFNISDIES